MNKIIYRDGKEEMELFPGKIICVGRNYVEHIKELENEDPGELVLFIKPNSSISEEIKLPDGQIRYEGEISFLIRGGKITAVGFGIDLTLPEVQNRLKKKGLPWEKAKAFDGSAVFSHFVPVGKIETLRLELWLNGELGQNGGIELMIYRPDAIMAEIKNHFSLEDNDLVMSGTPSGVDYLKPGDRVVGKIYAGQELLLEKEWNVQ